MVNSTVAVAALSLVGKEVRERWDPQPRKTQGQEDEEVKVSETTMSWYG